MRSPGNSRIRGVWACWLQEYGRMGAPNFVVVCIAGGMLVLFAAVVAWPAICAVHAGEPLGGQFEVVRHGVARGVPIMGTLLAAGATVVWGLLFLFAGLRAWIGQ